MIYYLPTHSRGRDRNRTLSYYQSRDCACALHSSESELTSSSTLVTLAAFPKLGHSRARVHRSLCAGNYVIDSRSHSLTREEIRMNYYNNSAAARRSDRPSIPRLLPRIPRKFICINSPRLLVTTSPMARTGNLRVSRIEQTLSTFQ